MGKVPKPIALCSGARTKEEIEERKEQEEYLKGDTEVPLDAPSIMNIPAGAKLYYQEILKCMPKDLFNRTDSYTIGIVANALYTMDKCQEIIDKEGYLVEYTNKAGATNISEHKAIGVYNKYYQIFNTASAKLGFLSPTDRAKLSLIKPTEEVDEFDMLVNMR